jgi:hypothetical protein
MQSSQPNPARCMPDSSHLPVSSTSHSSSSLISRLLGHNATIIAGHKVTLSISISPSHDLELTLSTAYTVYQEQRLPSTKNSVHQVPGTASTKDCVSSLHTDDKGLTRECSFRILRASLHNRPPSAGFSSERQGIVTLSHCDGCKLTD